MAQKSNYQQPWLIKLINILKLILPAADNFENEVETVCSLEDGNDGTAVALDVAADDDI